MMIEILIGVVILFLVGFGLARRIREKTEELRRSGVYPPEGQETDADVDRLIELGHKIEAIKVYRALHDVGLKEAKEAVERRQREMGWNRR